MSFLSETRAAGAEKKTLLFVGAHMDDSEWGAGGVMFKALNAGHRVVVVQAVSDWSNWPPSQGREKQVKEGVMRVAKQMGVEKILLGYKYHYVPVDLEIKGRIAEIMDDVKPDIAIIMSENDYWTDHANAGRAGKDGIMFAHGYLGRVVKSPPLILTYSAAANQTYDFRPDTFVNTTEVIDRVVWLIDELGVGGSVLVEKGPQYASRLYTLRTGGAGIPEELGPDRRDSEFAGHRCSLGGHVWGQVRGGVSDYSPRRKGVMVNRLLIPRIRSRASWRHKRQRGR